MFSLILKYAKLESLISLRLNHHNLRFCKFDIKVELLIGLGFIFFNNSMVGVSSQSIIQVYE